VKTVLRKAVRGLAAAAVISVTFATGVGSGSADPVPVVCDVFDPNGVTLTDNGNGTWSWTVTGVGDCEGGFPENYDVSFTGSGVSNGLGVCSRTVTSLVLDVHVVLSNSSHTIEQDQRWTVPLTPGVVASPFVIANGGTGAGTIFNRIFGACPGSGGTNASRFVWTQTV
jgi:hypothetical protein